MGKQQLLVPQGPSAGSLAHTLLCRLPLLIVFDPKQKCFHPKHSGFSGIAFKNQVLDHLMECSGSAKGSPSEPFGMKQRSCQTTLPSSPGNPMCPLVVIPLTPAAITWWRNHVLQIQSESDFQCGWDSPRWLWVMLMVLGAGLGSSLEQRRPSCSQRMLIASLELEMCA